MTGWPRQHMGARADTSAAGPRHAVVYLSRPFSRTLSRHRGRFTIAALCGYDAVYAAVRWRVARGPRRDAAGRPIDAATRQWMGWAIDRRTSKDYGIPRGMPYLIGFVIHCEIGEEAVAA